MVNANFYSVEFYRKDSDSGGCVRDIQFLYAYTAQDARYQVEVSREASFPKDPYFRVVKIEPAWDPNREGKP